MLWESMKTAIVTTRASRRVDAAVEVVTRMACFATPPWTGRRVLSPNPQNRVHTASVVWVVRLQVVVAVVSAINRPNRMGGEGSNRMNPTR